MAELDKLEIVVTADTKGAESSISSLLEKLQAIQRIIRGLSGSGTGKKIRNINRALDKNKTVKTLKDASKQATAFQNRVNFENLKQQNKLALEAEKQKNKIAQLSERARLSNERAAAKRVEQEASKAAKQAADQQNRLNLESIRQQNRFALEAERQKNRLAQMSERARISDERAAAKKAAQEAAKAAKEDPYWNDAALKARNEAALDRLFPTVQAVKTRIKGISDAAKFSGGSFVKSGSELAEQRRYNSSDYFNRARSRRYQQEQSAKPFSTDHYDQGGANFIAKYDQVAESLRNVKATADETRERLAALHQEMGSGAGGAEIAQDFGIQEGVFSRIGAALNSAMNQMPGFSSALTASMSRISEIGSNLRSAAGAALDFGKAVGSAAIHGFGSVMQGLLRPVTRLRDGFTEMTTALQGLLSRFGRLAVTRLFRMAIQAIGKAISEGINNVYQYSAALNGSFKGAMDSAATSMQYFKNSIGAAAAPLIQTFIPYLNAAVSAIVTFINIINQLFAALGGAVSFTRAKKSVTEFGKAAKGAGGGAGKAAKEMDKFLASWDEITNIKTPDDSGGGGGGGGGAGDFLDMFEEAPIDQAILDAINSGNWYGLGELLAQKLNDILPSEEQMYAWGRRLGELINNGINVALGFMRTFNFVGLGQRISMWLNGAISAIEWDKLGALIMRQTLALWDMAIGFIQRLDFGQIARAVSDLLLGAWRELTNWLNGWDWSEMGRMVADKIIDFLTNIKWEELGQTLWELFNAGVKAAADFFTALDEVFSEKLGPIWDVVKGIGAAFLLWKLADGLLGGLDLVSDVLALINTTTVGIGLILTGVYTLVQGIIDQVTNGLSWDSLGTQIGGIVILLGGLYLLLGPIGVAIGAIVTGITEFILGLREWMEVGKPSNEILTQMSVGIGLIGAGIALLTGAWIPLLIAGIGIAVLWIVGKWDEIKQKAAEVWEKIKEIWGVAVEWFKDTVITPIAELFESIKAGIKLAFDAAWEFIRDKWSAVAEWFSMTVIEPLKLVFEPIKAAIEGFLNDPIGTIQTAWTTFAEWFNTTFIIPVTTYFNSLKASIELGFEAAKQFIMDSWLTVAEWFNTTFITPVVNYFNSLKANIELAFEAAKQFVTDAWSTVSEWFSTNVTQPIYNFFSPLEEAIAGFLSNPVGVIKQAWADIKQWFQDTIITPISEAFSGLGETIKSAFFGGINAVIGGLNSFIGMVNNVGIDWDGFQQSVNVFGHTLNWGIPGVHLKPFNLPTIPTLEYASGGFPTEGEMFIAREAGPEFVGRMGNRSAVANNDQIVEGIRQGVYEAMVAANNGQNSREVKVYIDGKEITDYTRKRSNQMARALGV